MSVQPALGIPANDDCPMKTANAKPVHEIRLGSIKAALWKNDTNGVVRYNVTLSRLYKDGDQWKTTESFGRDDLLVLAKVADQAHTWICDQGRGAEVQARSGNSADA